MFDPESDNKGGGRRSLLDRDVGAPTEQLDSAALQDASGTSAENDEPVRPDGWSARFRSRFSGGRQRPKQSAETAAAPVREETRDMTRPVSTTSHRDPEDRPLIDPMMLLVTVWRFRFFVAFTTLLGAAMGVMVALSTPHLYEAVNQFVLDPRELRLTDTDLLPQSYSSQATLALVDSQVAVVDSSPVLQTVVNDLDLVNDPEFNGEQSSPVSRMLDSARSLFTSPDEEASDRNYLTVQSLSKAVAVYRGERTFIVYVEVDTQDPAKSALIANKIVDVYISKQQEAQSALFQRTAQSLNRQLEELRQDVETAERRVEQYKAENDLVDAGGNLITDTQLIELNQQLAQIRAQKVEIQVRAETASQLDVDALLSGTAPEILESSTIGELRAEYAAAKRNFDALATSLGPRHPQRIAAEQALTTARTEISNELRRIVEATQTELRRIVQLEQQLTADLAVLKTRQVDTNTNLVRLRELEREAAATSQIYQSFLRRARETGEQQNLNTSNIRVISEATPPLQPAGPSRKYIAAGGMTMGFIGGLALAMLVGAYRSVRKNAPPLLTESETDAVSMASEPTHAPSDALDDLKRRVLQPPDEAARSEPMDMPDRKPVHDNADAPRTGGHQAGTETPGHNREAQDIKAELKDLRDTVERLYEARKSAREAGRAQTPRGLRRADI